MSKALDLTGGRFGKLVVTGVAPSVKGKGKMYCVCDCGATTIVSTIHLKSGHTKSCGCYQDHTRATAKVTHGGSKTKLYATWTGIKSRCYNPKVKCFANYGGRGITVCDRWLNSFENFYADMGDKPFTEAQIDRIDNEKGYGPDNCRWSDKNEQNRNKRNIKMITYNGKTKCLSEWSEEIGLKTQILKKRIFKLGWDVERAFTEAVRAW